MIEYESGNKLNQIVCFNRLTVIKLEQSGSCVIGQIGQCCHRNIPKVILSNDCSYASWCEKKRIGLTDNKSHTAYDLHNKFNCWFVIAASAIKAN